MSDKYYEHAEFLVVRGYVEPTTNIEDLAKRLMEHDAKIIKNNTPRKSDVLTREKVYGENAGMIGEISDKMTAERKTLIEPGERESAALRHQRKMDQEGV